MRLLGLLLVIMMMTACGEGDNKKEEAADPAKADQVEASAADSADSADSSEGGDSTPETNDSEEAPDVLVTPPSEEK